MAINTKKEIYEIGTTKFEDGWRIILDSNLEIKELFDGTITKEEVQKKMIELITENMPNYEKQENTFWNFILQSNRVMLKTNRKISVGWNIATDENNEIEYVFQIVLHIPNMIYQKKALEEAGFVKVINE